MIPVPRPPPGSRRSSSSLRTARRAEIGRNPSGRKSAVGRSLQPPHHRVRRAPEQRQRPRHPGGNSFGALERNRLGHELSEHDVQIGSHAQREHDRHARRQERVEDPAEGRLAQRAQADPERADPHLHGADQPHRVLEQRHRGRGAAITRVGLFNQPPAPGGHCRTHCGWSWSRCWSCATRFCARRVRGPMVEACHPRHIASNY